MPSPGARAGDQADETWRVRALLILDRGCATAIGIVVMMDLGPNVTVFLLFFGLALLDATLSGDLIAACLWIALGLVFLRADTL